MNPTPLRFGFRGCALCASLLLAACSDRSDEAASGAGTGGEMDVPISATTRFDPNAFEPEEELAALADLPPGRRGEELLKLYYRWARIPDRGPEAVSHAEEYGSGSAGGALREAFRGWLATDRDGAQFWVATRPDGRRKTELAGALADALPNSPARAEWANEFGGTDTGRLLMSRVIAEWARENPLLGLSWLESEEDQREDLAGEVGQLVRAWVDRDAREASESIAAMEPGLIRDAAIRALVVVVGSEQAEAARQWAESIEDPELRSDTLQLVQRLSGGLADLPPVAGADDPSETGEE